MNFYFKKLFDRAVATAGPDASQEQITLLFGELIVAHCVGLCEGVADLYGVANDPARAEEGAYTASFLAKVINKTFALKEEARE